jgi:hypothetical protein
MKIMRKCIFIPGDFMEIKWEKIKNYSFIDNPPTKGRSLILGVVYDYEGDGFALYHPTPEGVIKLYASPIKSYYLAKHLVEPKYDVYLQFIDKMFLHYSYEPVANVTMKILFSINTVLASFENYNIFQKLYTEEYGHQISELVVNEFLSFFVKIRSFYDLIQEQINELFKVKNKQNFKTSFYTVANMSESDLKEKYNYPETLIYYHKGILGHLKQLRKIRDDLVHKGMNLQVVFSFDDGFGISLDQSIISQIDIFPEDKKKPNGIVSIIALFSYYTLNLMNDLSHLVEIIPTFLDPEPPISNEYHYYVRFPFNFHLNNMLSYFKDQWFSTPQIAECYIPDSSDMTSKI